MQCPVIAFAALVLIPLAGWSQAQAQQTQAPASEAIMESGSETAIKDRKNAWTVGLATGQIGAAYPRLAQDLAKVLDDGDNLRVLPVITYGSVGNVEDLLYLRNIDIAFTKSDSFEYFRKVLKVDLHARIHYIARLYDAELHLLVRPEIRSLEDLKGKKVNLGRQGNAANVTVPIVMERLGFSLEPIFVDHAVGLEMMKRGEIVGAFRVAGKPAKTYTQIPPDSGFYFLPITATQYAEHLSDLYVLGQLTHEDYPTLIEQGESISTIAVPDILAAYNWPEGTNRYQRVERFIEAFFHKFAQLQQPPFDDKWRDVNLAATIPGWTRAAVAERMLQSMAGDQVGQLRTEFDAFLTGTGQGNAIGAGSDREALFREFMTWRNQRTGSP